LDGKVESWVGCAEQQRVGSPDVQVQDR
jgi:hypothetical protein